MKFILAFLLSINLFASNIKSENIKTVLNDIEKEYILCLKEKKLSHMECVRIKESQIADLEVLDQNEIYAKKSIDNKIQKKDIKKTKEEIELKQKLDKCIDSAMNREDYKKCYSK